MREAPPRGFRRLYACPGSRDRPRSSCSTESEPKLFSRASTGSLGSVGLRISITLLDFDFLTRSYKNVSIPSNNSQLFSVWPSTRALALSLSAFPIGPAPRTSAPLLSVSTPNPPLWVHSSPSTWKVGSSIRPHPPDERHFNRPPGAHYCRSEVEPAKGLPRALSRLASVLRVAGFWFGVLSPPGTH